MYCSWKIKVCKIIPLISCSMKISALNTTRYMVSNSSIHSLFLLAGKSDSQSKLDLHSPFNLHEELKRILYLHKKEKIHVCADQVQFQFLISCFHNYEVNYALMICTCTYICLLHCVCLSTCVVYTINFLGSDKKRLTR